MRKAFMCSLICRNGILGGGLYLEDTAITYKTNKLTVDKEYRNLVLPLDKISRLTWKWVLFPIATFYMTSGEQYRLLIFNKRRFERYYTVIKRT